MQKVYTLSLDESGYADPHTYKISPYFVISGCIINHKTFNSFKERLNQIKFAIWEENWKKVFLRSADIGKGSGVFYFLYNKSSKGELISNENMRRFCKYLKNFYKFGYFSIISCLINKEDAVIEKTVTFPKGKKKMKYIWDQENVYKLTYREILENFLCFLACHDACGKIIAEASTDKQDIILYKEFFRLLANGIPKLKIDPKETKKRLSSLDFVTKQNLNPEEEIADAMGYAARLCYELKQHKRKAEDLKIYDQMIYKAFEKNLLKINFNGKDKRLINISKRISPLTIFPNKKTS